MKKKSILHLFCLLFSCLAIFGGIFLLTDTAIVDNNIEVSDEVEAADPIHKKHIILESIILAQVHLHII